jgi:hypothetical protein
MNLTGAGDHPAFVKAFNKLAAFVTEGSHVTGKGPSDLGQKPLGAPEPDWVSFHAFCCLIVLMGHRMGADMSEDWKAIQDSLGRKSLGFRLAVYWGAARFVAGLGLKWVLNRAR